ncbi:hypothetical protein [Rhodopila sp.]|uniref:hypothetical protein n=1 Tax=Rhodopila sp. TaxID=2480087 RepID=UPI003D0C2A6D
MLSDRRHPDEAPILGLDTLGMVESTVTRDGQSSTEGRFYLSTSLQSHGLRGRGGRKLVHV